MEDCNKAGFINAWMEFRFAADSKNSAAHLILGGAAVHHDGEQPLGLCYTAANKYYANRQGTT